MKNISKTTKTILFAGLITAMIFSFSGMQFAQAESVDKIPEDILKLAERGGKIVEKINHLKSKNIDGQYDNSIDKLKDRLSIIESKVDDYGLFSPEQMKIEMEKPLISEDDEEEILAACNCPTEVVFSSGIFYQMFDYFQGMSDGHVKILSSTEVIKTSTEQAHASINQNWGYLYTRAKIIDSGGQAELHIKPWIERSNGNIIKTYTEHDNVISSTNYIKIYEFPKFTSNAVGDNYIIQGSLNWIS